MNLEEFIAGQTRGGPTRDIRERWENRVMALGLTGYAGAADYLAQFGRRIGVAKCVKFAKLAEEKGDQGFANRMWEKAFEIDTGQRVLRRGAADQGPTRDEILAGRPEPEPEPEPMPKFTPGTVPTLQPQDTDEEPEFFIERDEFWGQPKIDGYRELIFVSNDAIIGQSRTLRVDVGFTEMAKPLNDALEELGKKGDFVLDGEMFFETQSGSEHRTGAQALTAARLQEGDPKVTPRYAIFDILMYDGEDLTDKPFSERWPLALETYEFLAELTSENQAVLDSPYFKYVPVAKTKTAKRRLLDGQKATGREGVVFRYHHAAYIAGKKNTAFRVKFVEDIILEVTALTPSPAGRQFGSLETEKGKVSSGLSNDDMDEIMTRFENREFMGPLMVEVTTQGFTENGKLWHPRVKRILPAE
jgi:bifunctional non-homologous end joining protein LigD